MLDAMLSAAIVLLALAFLAWRFRSKRTAPACAPPGGAQPQVIVGARLAQAMKAAKAKRPGS